jgi:uncharacterized damage-inducible protein DinB
MQDTITCVRPTLDECGEYFKIYVDQVPAGDVLEVLSSQIDELGDLIAALPANAHQFAYGDGKWSINQLLGHLLDTEWIFSSRCLWFARGNPGPLPSMDQDDFVAGANFDARSLADLVKEFKHLRLAGLQLFKSFDAEILDRRGTASGTTLSVRGLLFLSAGHAVHHLKVLRERYLPLLEA